MPVSLRARVRATLDYVLTAALIALAIWATLFLLAERAHAQSALEWAAQGMGNEAGEPGTYRRVDRRFAQRVLRAETRAALDIRTAPQIVAEASRYIGSRNPMGFRGPGCKVFVNMVARRAGLATNSSARAFDTAAMGRRVGYPQPGDYRVSRRRGGGHVEIVASVEGGRVTTINGNKGRNRVGWSHRSVIGAVYYRPIRLAGI